MSSVWSWSFGQDQHDLYVLSALLQSCSSSRPVGNKLGRTSPGKATENALARLSKVVLMLSKDPPPWIRCLIASSMCMMGLRACVVLGNPVQPGRVHNSKVNAVTEIRSDRPSLTPPAKRMAACLHCLPNLQCLRGLRLYSVVHSRCAHRDHRHNHRTQSHHTQSHHGEVPHLPHRRRHSLGHFRHPLAFWKSEWARRHTETTATLYSA